MDERQQLLSSYNRQINYLNDELKYHFTQIKILKNDIKKYQLLINAINNYQLPISFQ